MGDATARVEWVSPTQAFNATLWDYLWLDLRPAARFAASHWIWAQNAHPDAEGPVDAFAEQTRVVIVYDDGAPGRREAETELDVPHDQGATGAPAVGGAMAVDEEEGEGSGPDARYYLAALERVPLRRRPEQVWVVRGGFGALEAEYPTVCSQHPEASHRLVYPQRLCLPGFGYLFIGAGICSSNATVLRHLSIGLVVNATEGMPNCFEGDAEVGVAYCRVPVVDDLSANILEHMGRVVEAIDGASLAGRNVLVHCAQGKSRSATVLTAYLVAKRVPLADARSAVSAARSLTEPNANFLAQLHQYERDLRPLTAAPPPAGHA